ncbi:MAG: AMP-binding protein [Methylophilaceae bacterium]
MIVDQNHYSIVDENHTYPSSEIHRLARQYQQLIPAHAKVIGVQIDNKADWIAIDIMCIKSNRVLVPIPNFFNSEQIKYLIDEAGIQTLITEDKSLLKRYGFMDNRDAIDNNFIGSLPVNLLLNKKPSLHNVQKITFTSGSTGFPKGICLSASAQEEVAKDLAQLLNSMGIQRHMSLLPFSILLENVAGTYTSMLLGGTNFIFSLKSVGFDGVKFDESKCIQLIQEHKIESLILLPQLLQQIVNYIKKHHIVLDSLKFIAVGGAKVPVNLIEQGRALGLPVYEGYGLSECSSVVAVNTQSSNRVGSVGNILPSRQVRILDDEIEVYLHEGLRYLKGESIAPGWYKTGDLGYIQDEFLYVNGRKKNLVITSVGRNISPEWPEALLLEDPRVLQAMVTCFDEPYLSCILVCEKDLSADEKNSIMNRANKKLPSYARIDRCVVLTQPFSYQDGTLTANGRLKRNVIMEKINVNEHQLESECV